MKIFYFLFANLMCPFLIVAQTTSIPDPNFEQELINLGYDSGPIDGLVLTANISTVNYLDVGAKSISDLTGIQDFSALDTLMCDNNLLTSLNVTQNLSLICLECHFNQLTGVNVTNNAVLSGLNCSFNQLTSLDVTQNSALSVLSFSTNLVTSIDVSQNASLTVFRSYSNLLNSIDVSNNPLLLTLYCFDNQLSILNVTFNPVLEDLRCGENQLTNLDITQNPLITTLAFGTNQLTNIDISQNTLLKYFYGDNNQLANIDLSNNLQLSTFSCQNNLLTSLSLTENAMLVGLSCANNQLNCLNVKNGNNDTLTNLTSIGNTSLACIEVDSVAYSTTSWTNIDSQTSFSTFCNNVCSSTAVGIEESDFSIISFYPNPTTGNFNIELGEIKQDVNATLTTSLGQVVFSKHYASTNYINLGIDAPKGFYFLKLESTDGESKTIKVLKK